MKISVKFPKIKKIQLRFCSNVENPQKKGNKIYFSGIQPTGEVHLGNYLGAVVNWRKLQNELHPSDQAIFSIVDLHSHTTEINRGNLSQNTLKIASVLLACGIDPKKSILFRQSHVSGHAELHWLLSCITPMFLLNNMIQYKEKVKAQSEAHVGLFTYPVLMASDILLYRTTHVPVGEDQVQHLNFARILARKANQIWKTDHFIEPETLLTSSSRVMSLTDASKKMSKSDPLERGKISLFDSPDVITSKIKRAKTDCISGLTYDTINRPEVSNLIDIYSALSKRSVEDICKQFESAPNLLGFKLELTDVVINYLAPIHTSLREYEKDPGYVNEILKQGAQQANEIAQKNIQKIHEIVGNL